MRTQVRLLIATGILATAFSVPGAHAQQNSPLFITGSACLSCTLTQGAGQSYTMSCKDEGGVLHDNTIIYSPDLSGVMVNNIYHQCTRKRPSPVGNGCSSQLAGVPNWFSADNTNGALVGIDCNVNGLLSFYGSAQQSCTPQPSAKPGTLSFNCANEEGTAVPNTVAVYPAGPQIVVNNIAYNCSTDEAPQPYDNPPVNAATRPWFRADNINGQFTSIACNIPASAPISYSWSEPGANVYQDPNHREGLVEILPNMSFESAKKHANESDVINFYYMGGDGNTNLKNDEAAFFTGMPSYGPETGPTLFTKVASPLIRNLWNGIYAYYSFNLNGDDESGQNNNATLNDSVLFEEGHNGNALQFSGEDLDAQVTLPTLTNPSLFGFGFAVWVRPDTMSSTNNNHMASIMGPLYIDTLSHKIEYVPSNTSYVLKSAEPVTVGDWVHVAVTYNPITAQEDLYINGARSASAKNLPVLDFTPWGSTIGVKPATVPPAKTYATFLGAVDEVFLYQRTLLPGDIIFLSGIHQGDRRSLYPQSSSSNAGQPGYEPEKKCEDSLWFFCLHYQNACRGSIFLANPPPYCPCLTGTKPNSDPGTGCSKTEETATVKVNDIKADASTGNLAGKEIIVQNASHAIVQPVPRDVPPSRSRTMSFLTTCETPNQPPSVVKACAQLKPLEGTPDAKIPTCAQLEIATSTTGKPVLNYPNYNISEWGTMVDGTLGSQHSFVVINSNFWSKDNNTLPCGAPLGNVIGIHGNYNEYQLDKFDSIVLSRDPAKGGNEINFYTAASGSSLVPPPTPANKTTVAFAGHFLRADGKNTPADEMKLWNEGKPMSKEGRTAVGYEPVDPLTPDLGWTLRFIVLPPNSNAGSGLTAAQTLDLFDDKKYTYVLLLDGGGSSTFVQWINGKGQKPLYKKQQNGEKIRPIPTAIVIAVPPASN